MTQPHEISAQVARQYVLGKQGLFPGRRFKGKSGLEAAFREIETVQIDPISSLARSHDLSLFARVEDYSPVHLDELLHSNRFLFDYGTILMIYLRDDLPFMVPIMQRRWRAIQKSERISPELRLFVLNAISERGSLSSRDFANRERIAGGFNTIKDTSAALYHLWLGGQIMSHSRDRNERRHDLFERVTGTSLESHTVTLEKAEDHFFRKSLQEMGLATPSEWARNVAVMIARRPSSAEAREIFERFVREEFAFPVKIEGLTSLHYALSQDREILECLASGNTPASWKSPHSTEKEVTLIAPLDSVIWDRARTRSLFNFDYVWEVYKPASVRKWGYYTLPVLYGDTLAGRVALKLDRKASTLLIEGAWTEPNFTDDSGYETALKAGLERLRLFLGAERMESRALAL